MADYYPLIARAIAGLDPSAPGESRRALYERARAALITQLRGVQPPLSESEITRERLSLEEAVRKVESEAAQRAREARSGGAAPRAGDAFRRSTPRSPDGAPPAAGPSARPPRPSAPPTPPPSRNDRPPLGQEDRSDRPDPQIRPSRPSPFPPPRPPQPQSPPPISLDEPPLPPVRDRAPPR